MQNNHSLVRLPMLLVMLLLTGGLYGGLIRLGWDLPIIEIHLSRLHGVLMVAGVFGTVIATERAVALHANSRSRLTLGAFIPPALSAFGSALLFTRASDIGKMLIVLSGIGDGIHPRHLPAADRLHECNGAWRLHAADRQRAVGN